MSSIFTPTNITDIIRLLEPSLVHLAKQLPVDEFFTRLTVSNFDHLISEIILSETSTPITEEECIRLFPSVLAKATTSAQQKLAAIMVSPPDPLEQLIVLKQITQIFCLRTATKERFQITELPALQQLYAKTLTLMQRLGFVSQILPHKDYGDTFNFDFAIVWGGLDARIIDRTNFLLKLMQQGYTFNRIVFLGGNRPLDANKESKALELLQALEPVRPSKLKAEPYNEYDIMKLRAEQLLPLNSSTPQLSIFATADHMGDEELTTAPRDRNTYVLTLQTTNGTPVDLVNGASLRGKRPNTPSTIEDYLAFLNYMNFGSKPSFFAKAKPKIAAPLSVCSISTQPHAMQQALVATGIFPNNYKVYASGDGLTSSSTSDLWDNFARFIYQFELNLQKKNNLTKQVTLHTTPIQKTIKNVTFSTHVIKSIHVLPETHRDRKKRKRITQPKRSLPSS